MKKLLLSLLFIGGLSVNAQTILFQDSFETYEDFLITGFGDWGTLDIDGLPTYTGGSDTPTWANSNDPQAFQIFNPTTAVVTNATSGAEVRNFDPKTGLKYAASWAAVPGAVTANEDWLISPAITLGSTGNELKVWVKSMSNSYGLEDYSIGVYVGTGTPLDSSEFSILLSALQAPYPNWEEITVGLDNYSGQTIRIGIRNEGSDHYMFMVDDFKVTTTGLKVDQFLADKFNVSPNPANNVISVSNTQGITLTDVSITDINGRTVKNVTLGNVSETQLNVSELTSGIYFLTINSDAGKAVKKFVKN